MPPKDASAAASTPAVPPGHFAVNVPLPSIVLPELIIRREAQAALADFGGIVLSAVMRDDGSFAVKVSVAKQYAISLYKSDHPDDAAPEAKAVAATAVRHIAALIIARLKSSIESARATVENNPVEGMVQRVCSACSCLPLNTSLSRRRYTSSRAHRCCRRRR